MQQGLLVTALLLACGTAQASDWVSLGKSESETLEFFVDTSSIRVAGNIRRAWSKTVYPSHTQKGFGEDAGRWIREVVVRQSWDCDAELSRLEAHTVYFDDGASWTKSADALSGTWDAVIPDSMGEKQVKFICAWPKGTP